MDTQTSDPQTSPPVTERFPNKRIAAFVIDLLFLTFVSLFLLGDLSYRMIEKGLMPASLIFEGLYLLLRDGLFQGQSLGKLVVGIRVVDLNGRPCNCWKSIVRNLIFVLPGAVTYAIFSDLVWMFLRRFLVVFFLIEYFVFRFSPEGRRLGDRWAKTRVIDIRPHWKDAPFLWISLALFLFLGCGLPSLQFIILKKQADSVLQVLEEHKKTHHGFLPEKLEELGIKPNPRLIFTRYLSYRGSPEFYLTGINAPFPNLSYSSERKEWRVHQGGAAWTQEEMGINETSEGKSKLAPRAIDKDPKEARRTERALIALSREQEKKTPLPSTPVAKPVIAVPLPEEKRPEGNVANQIQRGGEVVLLLRNGQKVKGRVVDKNPSGVWLEIGEGARAYFFYQEIAEVEALKG